MTLCQEALDNLVWNLRDGFDVEPTETGCLLVTPFMRSDNEHIQIELTDLGNRVVISDNGETADYLFVNGLDPDRSRIVRERIRQIAARFLVTWSGGELFRESTVEGVAESFWKVLEAAREVGTLIYKKAHRAPRTFDEEVEKELIAHEFAYDSDFEVPGKSTVHRIRFYLKGNRNILIQPLTATSPHVARAKAKQLAFDWVDIEEGGGRYRKIAVVDNVKDPALWAEDAVSILETYSDNVVLWANKPEFSRILSERGQRR